MATINRERTTDAPPPRNIRKLTPQDILVRYTPDVEYERGRQTWGGYSAEKVLRIIEATYKLGRLDERQGM